MNKQATKHLLLLTVLVVALILPILTQAQELKDLKRFSGSLPIFASYAGIKAVDGLLTIGAFSDKSLKIDNKVLQVFSCIKAWDAKAVTKITGHKKVKVVPLYANTVAEFDGQIIWVLDAKASLNELKAQTQKGVFTIGVQEPAFADYLFTTLIYENKSSDPQIKKWRLEKLIANCELSPLEFSRKLLSKPYFSSKNCKY